MRMLKRTVLAQHGYSGDDARCEDAELCPEVALSDLFEGGGRLTRGRIATVLAAVPPYFSQAVIASSDGSGLPDTAHIGFGIPVMPLDDQKRLIDEVRTQLGPDGAAGAPPPGVEAEVAGLPVLAAEANDELSGSRYWLAAAGLAAVAAALLVAYRCFRRALVPLVPIALATGWSALVVWLVGIPLNPMSTTLGALVIAIATEFSVLLSARFEEERDAGHSVGEALRRTYARTGAAVAASGATAIAGFAVLIASDVAMLRDFGIVTVVDLGVALAGVMLVLPATLVWAESGFAPFGRWTAESTARAARR
jgi:predicted RND superfamily exporter protein